MKVISTDVARTTWLFPLTELNPYGKSLTQAFRGLADRYNFKSFPAHSLDFDKESKGFLFNAGEFVNHEGARVVAKLSIFTDGIVSDTWSSTRDSEDFLEDVMKWVKREHGVGLPPDRKVKTLYLSQFTVTTDKHIGGINPKLQAFADLVSAKVGDRWGGNSGFNVGGIGFRVSDPTKQFAPSPFRFELKDGTRIDEKRYFTLAPVQTDVHLELLDKLEELFG